MSASRFSLELHILSLTENKQVATSLTCLHIIFSHCPALIRLCLFPTLQKYHCCYSQLSCLSKQSFAVETIEVLIAHAVIKWKLFEGFRKMVLCWLFRTSSGGEDTPGDIKVRLWKEYWVYVECRIWNKTYCNKNTSVNLVHFFAWCTPTVLSGYLEYLLSTPPLFNCGYWYNNFVIHLIVIFRLFGQVTRYYHLEWQKMDVSIIYLLLLVILSLFFMSSSYLFQPCIHYCDMDIYF